MVIMVQALREVPLDAIESDLLAAVVMPMAIHIYTQVQYFAETIVEPPKQR